MGKYLFVFIVFFSFGAMAQQGHISSATAVSGSRIPAFHPTWMLETGDVLEGSSSDLMVCEAAIYVDVDPNHRAKFDCYRVEVEEAVPAIFCNPKSVIYVSEMPGEVFPKEIDLSKFVKTGKAYKGMVQVFLPITNSNL
ncbi:MAG: hypothetical protein R3A11_09695 [Bdellovibrionota bacterium]